MLTDPSESARTEMSEMENLSPAAPAGESIVTLEYLWLANFIALAMFAR